MDKNFGSWFHQQHLHQLSPCLNLFGYPFDTGRLNAEMFSKNTHSVEDITLGTLPLFPSSGLQQSKMIEPNEPNNWFHGMPHSGQAFNPVLNSTSKENFPGGSFDLDERRNNAPAQKRFLIFDQSGDRTALIYSSGFQVPPQRGKLWGVKPPTTCNFRNEEPRYDTYPSRPIISDENIEDDSRYVMENEMHEDTEELNLLLCSDDDSDFSEDEETSTGHSPSTMTDDVIPDLVEQAAEEVDSFCRPTKRQKLSRGCYVSSSLEDVAESSCENVKQCTKEPGPQLCDKKMRKDKILETVTILRSIIPSGNGSDAIAVIDEAICYLRSLKVKAEALGLDTL